LGKFDETGMAFMPETIQRTLKTTRQSVLDIAGGLPTLLLGIPLVLPAVCVALLIVCATFLLGVPGILPGVLAHVTPLLALLGLFRAPHRSGK
jgi:hypothetical protein